MRVLFVGPSTGQSLNMYRSIQRAGHNVVLLDPYAVLQKSRLLKSWAFHSGGFLVEELVHRYMKQALEQIANQDVILVDNGDVISVKTLKLLRTKGKKTALFNRDNPFVSRDGFRWRALLQALPFYDLYATPRDSTAAAAKLYGVRRVLKVNFFADEVLHRPRLPDPQQLKRFRSPVSFVGTWFPERGPFMQTLIDRGVPLKVVGNKWHRAKNWRQLRHHVVEGYFPPDQYCDALLSCDIAIAMLSKGNEDVVTSRSVEIPALGKLLCAERTQDHELLYLEGKEAMFWSSADECADICLALLQDPKRIASISSAGRRATELSGNWSQQVMCKILNTALEE